MKTMKSVLPKAGMIFLIFTLLCGVIYTGVVTGIAQLIFPDNANGSIIEVDGKKYGCELLGQQYTDEALPNHTFGAGSRISGNVDFCRIIKATSRFFQILRFCTIHAFLHKSTPLTG